MKKLMIVTFFLFLLSSCKRETKNCYSNFTYSKGNIRMSYLLKFNSSDTVYYQDRYPYGKKGIHYFLLEKNEKKMLDSLICDFKFPKDSVLLNNGIEDGTTIAFSIDNKRVMLHGHKGPEQFWKFEEGMNMFLNYKQLKPIKRNVKFDKFEKMLYIPEPKIDTITGANSRFSQLRILW